MLGHGPISERGISDVPFLQTVTATGIASAEAFGSAKSKFIEYAAGIASAEAFGSDRIIISETGTGIVSAGIFGSPDVKFIEYASGIASAEAFGLASVTLVEYAIGIESAEEFGAPLRFVPHGTLLGVAISHSTPSPRRLAQPARRFQAIGIPSEEAFGLPELRLSYRLQAVGIPSEEAFGDASVTMTLTARGIWTQERVSRVAVKQDWTEQNNLALLLAAA
jgi:hypothetical protein